MRATTITILWAATALVAGTTVAGAAPTDLNVMPIAETVPKGQCTFGLEYVDVGMSAGGDATWSLLSAAGVTRGLEIGIDLEDLDGDTTWLLDTKWQFVQETDQHPALALGLLNINRSRERGYYVVGAQSLSDELVRLHGGLLHSDGTTSGMLGGEVEVAPNLTAAIDWISGPEGEAGLGLGYALDERYEISVSGIEGNSGGQDTQWGLCLFWQGSW